ncbi:MAG: hypothetical protein GX495_18950 [Chloroflexi bacterium]|nr:hypothetical protein [Chloroflexota bacterium]
MDELPHWRVVMQRERDGHPDCDPRVLKMGQEHAQAIDEMRTILRQREIVSNRDFDPATRTRMQSYRGRKDSSLALYYLWRTGEVMTHHRENFERVYALAEAVAPAHLFRESSPDEADRFLIRKEVCFAGLSRLNRTSDAFFRGVPFSIARQIVDQMLAAGELIEVKVEGWRAVHYALASDSELLAELIAGRIPQAWIPLERTTQEEVVFLAPLDPVCARGRAKVLFGVDYVWEVYKPEHQRKFGYYALPVLWGDRLVARFDSRFDRSTGAFVILGFWLEDEALAGDEAFARALACGFSRFAAFLGASRMDTAAVSQPLLRQSIEAAVNSLD